ncbi:hypothetical protein [Parasitella parasitica]|uniref:Tetraspanin n=1 Tax=Parasitella parasitica TaxID=35722 RepID=A0A0B7NT02_9FUNG|nr:hypothetical protein [Parasitella parasitica]
MKITDSILFPVNILKMVTILGLILVFTSLVVVIAFVYQISIAVIVYDDAAHISNWMSNAWNNSTKDYKLYAQRKFSCCGFSNPKDHSVATNTCFPDDIINSAQPCYGLLTAFIRSKLSSMYIALFTSLSIELLALCNVITHLCTSNSKKWEVSPEEQYVRHGNYSADTLVASNSTTMYSKSRQF